MKIKLDGVGKRYRREWILRDINLELEPAGRYAVAGPNGSGKSTFLRMLSGHLSPSRGTISFIEDQQPLAQIDIYQYLAFAAPYIELIEEFTLLEALHFHQGFRPFLPGLTPLGLIDLLGLKNASNLPIVQFSSGMKQRLKLALACTTEARFILLDEPTTNLDTQGMNWYQELLETYLGDRLVVIASNIPADYQVCTETIDILAHK